MADTEQRETTTDVGSSSCVQLNMRAVRNGAWKSIDIYAFGYDRSDRAGMWVPQPIVYERHTVDGLMRDPLLRLSQEQAAALMDDLWNAGVRPSDQGTPGQLAAMQAHIGDLRAIAFKALGVENP